MVCFGFDSEVLLDSNMDTFHIICIICMNEFIIIIQIFKSKREKQYNGADP